MITLDQCGRGSPSVAIYSPEQGLQEFVEFSWIERTTGEGHAKDRAWRVVPDASGHLIFQVRRRSTGADPSGPQSHRLVVVGPRSTYTDIDKSSRHLTIGVRFRPGVLPLLFGVLATELGDRGVELEVLVGSGGREATERVAEGEDPEAALRVLEVALLSLLRTSATQDWRVVGATRLIEERKGRGTVDGLCEELGVAPRTLRKAMREHVGLAPKRVVQIRRLYQAIRLLQRQSLADGSSVAHAAGYCDQPHMIREFHSLLGETPEQFARRGG